MMGNIYDGNWEDDKKHGKGEFICANNDKYVGEFKNDIKSGYGTYFWVNGDKFSG
jgi:hypothetical protein